MALRVSACVATGGWLANLGWLDILCYITAFLVPVLAVPGMFTAWKNKALGQRGRRPDPVIAALLCNCAWFEFGWTEKSDEAMCINLYGGVFQAMYLATFFVLCSGGERVGAIKRVLPAALFLGVTTLPVGVELHKVLCTVWNGCRGDAFAELRADREQERRYATALDRFVDFNCPFCCVVLQRVAATKPLHGGAERTWILLFWSTGGNRLLLGPADEHAEDTTRH